MKLSRAQANAVKDSLDLDVIDETQEIQRDLEDMLGEHTFFINDKGLFIFVKQDERAGQNRSARLFAVAAWSNDDKKELVPIQPPAEVDVLIDLVNGAVIGGK